MRLTIVVADDHPLFRTALRSSLNDSFNSVVFLEAGTFEDAMAKIESGEDIDILLLDLSMPGMNGFTGLVYVRSQYPSIPVVVISAHEDVETIKNCLECGASGYIPKSASPEKIKEGVESVLRGEMCIPEDFDLSISVEESKRETIEKLQSLTPQQIRVLMKLREGLLNKQIAYEFSVSEATVKAHVSAILHKLGVDSRTQAVIMANNFDASLEEQKADAP